MYKQAAHVHVLEAPGLSAVADENQWQTMATRYIHTGKTRSLALLKLAARIAPLEFRENEGVVYHYSPVSSTL